MNRWGISLLLFCHWTFALELHSWQTESGTQVIFAAAPQLPIVDIRILFDAGSARDGKKHGLAYLTNALLTEGAGSWNAQQIARQLDEKGIEINTKTDRDWAWIGLRSLSEKKILTLAVDILAQILVEPHFEASAIERIKQKMNAQIRLDQQSPAKSAHKILLKSIYQDHPYAHDPLGTPDTLARIQSQDIRLFYQTHYTAQNAVIVIVGDLIQAQAKSLAKRITEQMHSGSQLPPLVQAQPPLSKAIQIEFDSDQTHCYLGTLGASYQDKDYFALLVGNHIFGGGGLTSLLGEQIRNQRGLSYGISSRLNILKAGGYWIASAQTRSDRADETMHLMNRLLTQFIQNGPTEEQIKAAKQYLIDSFPLRLSSNKKIVEQLSLIAFYHLPLNWLDTYQVRIEQIDAQQVKKAFAHHINAKHWVQLMLGRQK